jgi:TonB family protein
VAARPPSRPRADAITRVPDDERPAPALAAADAAESGAERAAGAPSAVGAEQLASLGHGAGEGRGDAGVGSGDGRGGAGVGSGAGGGSDGLRAFCARCPAPVYPGRARRQGWQGTVDVELVIGRGGAVEAARIGRSSGYPTLDDVALAVARESRFTVPTDGAGLRGELRYRFVLDATAAER